MLKMFSNSSVFSEFKLSEGGSAPTRVQILRVGKFKNPKYGNFEITPLILKEMQQNFEKRVRGIDVGFDYYHENDKDASGWPKKLSLSADGKELWAEDVEWTPTAAKKIIDRELRYFSPEFVFKWTDPESGVTHNNVLFGGGLTNRPFIKEMQAIVADEKERGHMDELQKTQADLKAANTLILQLQEQLKNQGVKLSEQTTALGEIVTLKKELETAKTEIKTLSEEKAKATKEAEFTALLVAKKAVPAQKDAFMSGNMTEFIKLSESTNTEAKGSSGSGAAPDEKTEAEQEAAVIKLSEEMMKADASLPQIQAMVRARKQLKEAK